MKVKNNWELEKSNEDIQTVLASIAIMPPAAKEHFFKSVAGRELYKGLQMLAENEKTPNQDGMTWTPEDIERINEALIQASYEDAELIMSLLPGPVAAIVQNRLNAHKGTPPNYNVWTKVKGDVKKSFMSYKEVMAFAKKAKELVKGARKDSPGYDRWLAAIRAKRHAKVGPDAMSRPTKYRHFLRRVKPDTGKIVDKPTGSKSDKSKES